MGHIQLWGDGAVKGNGKPEAIAGWGTVVLVDDKLVREFNGQLAARTYPPYQSNNTGEMTAIIEGLRLFEQPVKLDIYTDSQYVIKGATEWHKNWERNNWKTTEGKSVANQRLWKELLFHANLHEISWHHVKGHSGVDWNERCDSLAKDGVKGILVDNVYEPMALLLKDVPVYIPVVLDFEGGETDY